ncbi:hypothetical protein NKF26_20230 [Haladaptatus sp. AB618]|uniref:hypothetical protein n=1 Tax=Haladaptatus sp. AB618 TaxID=2934173 RepID=UPI00209C16DB|nr:hypothetical protein [Haladaptatus sp. AB618]MCO8256142.1 hypothetical protein [Haladaptatus sp. AB618]
MSTAEYARRLTDHPLGRLVILIAGITVIGAALLFYPPFGTVVWWLFPTLFVLVGVSELYFRGADGPLSMAAGSLLVLGGVSRALYQLVPMDEFTGTVANVIPLFGIFAMMYARHYGENE